MTLLSYGLILMAGCCELGIVMSKSPHVYAVLANVCVRDAFRFVCVCILALLSGPDNTGCARLLSCQILQRPKSRMAVPPLLPCLVPPRSKCIALPRAPLFACKARMMHDEQ